MPAYQSLSQMGTIILDTFKGKLEREWTQKAVCGGQYVLILRLKAWMLSKEEGTDLTNAGRLLQAVYRDYTVQPIDSQDIISGYLLVFAILLKNDWGDLVHYFRMANITDVVLSSSLLSYEGLRDLEREDETSAQKVKEVFDSDRWAFCPIEIRSNIDKIFIPHSAVVTYCRRQAINGKGGTAKLFEVLVQEDFISPGLQKLMANSRVKDEYFGMCYQLALKSYRAEEFFNWETSAFMALRGQAGMVQYICSYRLPTHVKKEGRLELEETHNILLEFGELDLDEFFAECDPPAHPLEIIGFWERFFKIADALEKVHYTRSKNRDGSEKRLHGWHADIKPDNILRVQGEFKLADFGFSKFKTQDQAIPTEIIEGGTITYGAPESDKGRQARGTLTPVLQTIDTWSFGCVLSVAVTWVVLGYQGVMQYEILRRMAIDTLRTRRKNGENIRMPTADDAFHNGLDVLPEVLGWFDYLRRGLRRSDFACGRVLDLVREAMLLKDPNHRIDSPNLCKRLKDILVAARNELEQEEKGGGVRPINALISKVLQEDLQSIFGKSLTAPQKGLGIGPDQNGSHFPVPSKAEALSSSREGLLAAPSDRGSKSWKRGKSERLEKSAHRAMQHSQVFSVIKDSSANASSAANPAIPEEPAVYDSPTDIAQPIQVASPINSEIPQLPPKGPPLPPSIAAPQLFSHDSLPAVVVDTPKKHEKEIIASPLQYVKASQPGSYAEKESTLPETSQAEIDEPQPSPVEWPVLDPYGDYDCHQLRSDHPTLGIFKTRDELEKQKVSKVRALFQRPKKDQYLERFIKNRDIFLIFDNGASMSSHWPIAAYTAETLAMKVANLDDDGLDYAFTIGAFELKKAKGQSAGQTIKKSMQSTAPARTGTDMRDTLSKVFDHYMRGGQRKRMTLLIFTDGVWESTIVENAQGRRTSTQVM